MGGDALAWEVLHESGAGDGGSSQLFVFESRPNCMKLHPCSATDVPMRCLPCCTHAVPSCSRAVTSAVPCLVCMQIFLYMFFVFVAISVAFMCFRGKQQWGRQRSKYDVYKDIGN